MPTARYVCFRFFLVPITAHLFARPASSEERISWFKESFLVNADFKSKFGTEYAIRITHTDEHLTFGKLSRKHFVGIHEKQADDITEMAVEDWPFLDFVCDERDNYQLLIIQFNSRVIQRVSDIAQVLSDQANVGMYMRGYAVSFQPLVSDKAFWSYVNDASALYRVAFDLRSPNFFGADQKANEALTTLREAFNNTSAQIALSNERGELRLPKERVEPYREYADKGGGNWELVVDNKKTGKKGKKGKSRTKSTIKSSDRAVRVQVEYDDSDAGRKAVREALQKFLGWL